MLDKIKKYPATVLREVCEPVEFDAKTKFLGQRLITTMNADRKSRMAVAAPQIGVLKQAFSYNLTGYQSDVSIRIPHRGVIFNPKVLDWDSVLRVADEGCLSFPGQTFKIRRPLKIGVEWYSASGERTECEMLGMASRLFQHELDHLLGILVIDRTDGGALAHGGE